MNIRAEHHDDSAVHERTTQYVYRAHALDKVEMLARILQAKDRGLTIIFSRTKRTAAKVSDELFKMGQEGSTLVDLINEVRNAIAIAQAAAGGE